MVKTWSTLPHEAYAVDLGGERYGIGAREIWDQVPGAWNILQLVWSEKAERLLKWSGPLENFPLDCGFVPYAVAFALQPLTEGRTWGELAASTSPSEFLSLLKIHPEQTETALILVIGDNFWTRTRCLLSAYKEFSGNVIQHDFRAAGRTQ